MRVIFGAELRQYAYVGDDVSCLYLQNAAPAAPLVVTFDYWRHSRDDVTVYAEAFCRKHRFNQFHLFPASNNWFQTPEMERALEVFDRVRHPKARVITYGGSMGGFAALHFARRLQADTVIAISPQVQIDPRKPPFDARWPEVETLTYLYNDLDVTGVNRVFAVYDPLCREDRQHIQHLPKTTAITLVPIIGGGHSPNVALTGWGLMEPLLLSLLDGSYQHRRLRADIRPIRAKIGYYVQNMNEYLARHRKSYRLPTD